MKNAHRDRGSGILPVRNFPLISVCDTRTDELCRCELYMNILHRPHLRRECQFARNRVASLTCIKSNIDADTRMEEATEDGVDDGVSAGGVVHVEQPGTRRSRGGVDTQIACMYHLLMSNILFLYHVITKVQNG